jgi:hypothetical protein
LFKAIESFFTCSTASSTSASAQAGSSCRTACEESSEAKERKLAEIILQMPSSERQNYIEKRAETKLKARPKQPAQERRESGPALRKD